MGIHWGGLACRFNNREGRVHRSVVGSFMPYNNFSIVFNDAFLDVKFNRASRCCEDMEREAIDNSGSICPTSVVGSPGIIISHICVDITRRPLANAIFSGHVVFCLLWMGMPSMTKIWVALESAIASFNAIVIAAYAHFNSCRGANEENADSTLDSLSSQSR